MKLLWTGKKKECDTEQQGACLKTQFKPSTVVPCSCAGRGGDPAAFPCESEQHEGRDRIAGLIPVPRAQQKPISWLGTLLLDRNKSSYPGFPAGGTSSRSVQAGLGAAAELLEQIRMSSRTSDFPSCRRPWWGHCPTTGCCKRGGGDGAIEDQVRKQSRQAKISSRMSQSVMIFLSLLPCSLNAIILHLPLFVICCYW